MSNAILFDFYVDGSLILNEQKLRRSGLYDETEISRILSDPSVLNEVSTSMRKLIDSSINEHDREKDNYLCLLTISMVLLFTRRECLTNLVKSTI